MQPPQSTFLQGLRPVLDLLRVHAWLGRREFAEETLGLFNGTAVDACSVHSSALQMADQLRQRTKCLRIVSQLREGCYVMFVALTQFVDSIFFHLATQQNCYKQPPMPGAEKIAFAW